MTQPASTVALLGAEAGTTDGALSDDGSQEHGEQRRQQGAASTSAADLAARGDPLSAEVRRSDAVCSPLRMRCCPAPARLLPAPHTSASCWVLVPRALACVVPTGLCTSPLP